MEEKIILNALLATERNFVRVDQNFGKVANALNKQAKYISEIAVLSGIAFVCTAVLFNIQDKQIKQLQAQVRKLEQPTEGCCGEYGCDQFEKGFDGDLDDWWLNGWKK